MKNKSKEKFYEFLSTSAENIYEHDLYATLRWLDANSISNSLFGQEKTVTEEKIILRQQPSMLFASSTIADITMDEKYGKYALSILSFGLFGPNGPLPLHITEYAMGRKIHHKDNTISAFADIFHQRLITLFYRAWADAQSTVSLDHGTEKFSKYIASLIGQRYETSSSVVNHAKYFFAGHFMRNTRNTEGLQQIIATYFNVKVKINEFVPHWIELSFEQQLRLGNNNSLGDTTIVGNILDVQYKFNIELGPLSFAEYQSFTPQQKKSTQLLDLVRQYIGIEYEWDVTLKLKYSEVPQLQLNSPKAMLGISSWVIYDSREGDDKSVTFNYAHYQDQAN